MVNIVSWMVDLKFSLAAETTENILTAVLLVQRQEHVHHQVTAFTTTIRS